MCIISHLNGPFLIIHIIMIYEIISYMCEFIILSTLLECRPIRPGRNPGKKNRALPAVGRQLATALKMELPLF